MDVTIAAAGRSHRRDRALLAAGAAGTDASAFPLTSSKDRQTAMLRLYNTLTRREEDFAPLRDNTVRMYTCGPTVYNRGHIGNFRTFVCLDVLRRALKYHCGYQVRQVMNFTDVDDRTIAGSQKAGMPLREYTDQYIAAFREDTADAGHGGARGEPARDRRGQPAGDGGPHHARSRRTGTPIAATGRSTSGSARSTATGSWRVSTTRAFSPARASTPIPTTRTMPGTSCCGKRRGPTSRRGTTGRDRAARAGTSSARRWRCGCWASAPIDLHAGGVDLVFPHHENEIAQSEGATKTPFSRFWVHVEHLLIDEEKMSKSLGNQFNVPDIVAKGYRPSALRYLYISTHYRKQLKFSWASLRAGRRGRAAPRWTSWAGSTVITGGGRAPGDRGARREGADRVRGDASSRT